MALPTLDVCGLVERRLLAAGSKSEQRGLVLVADDGRVWTLRRVGGPAFGDAELAVLEGRRIQATARVRDRLLLLERWQVLA
ncbi:MAG: hypothetical protein RLZZ584_1172 [Pseudomonadota bacterium]|jgi:hypothetical protein